MAEHNLVHIARGNSSVGEGPFGHPHYEAFDCFTFQTAEGRMRPAHDASGHECLLLILIRLLHVIVL
jgi:hypothetical protein